MAVTQWFTIELPEDAQVAGFQVELNREDAETLFQELSEALFPVADFRGPIFSGVDPVDPALMDYPGDEWSEPEQSVPAIYPISVEEADRRLAAQQATQGREDPPRTSGGSAIGNLHV